VAAACAWLRLSQEFVQDGFYKFELDRQGFTIGDVNNGETLVNGSNVVVPENGNKGLINATLRFDKSGKFLSVKEDRQVVMGIRPRCQATRLLDPDPVIRAICEQDLLVLGRSGYEYLTEQRAQARPELQQAIDRVWNRILVEGR
jgi:hypothetical protein